MASSGLFNRLLDLHARYPGRIPEEDFFTELVAYLFETTPMILMTWLESIGWKKMDDYQTIRIDTQTEYEALSEHNSGSRPDMRIELLTEETRDVIFVESKLGAGEGDHQLQRYAEILDHDHSADQKWLIYITRSKDTKDPSLIFQNIVDSSIEFRQMRWRDFYLFLLQQPQDFLISEVIGFMKENGMAKQIHFSETDLPAMANLQNPFQLMLAVLDKELRRLFQAVVGSRGDYSPIEYLTKDWARLAFEGRAVEGGLHCIVGFDNLARGGNPRLCIILHVMPENYYGTNRQLRKDLVYMLRDIVNKNLGWVGHGLDNPRVYSSIEKNRSLRELMPSEDLEEECKKQLTNYLDEFEKLKRQYPDIPWKINM